MLSMPAISNTATFMARTNLLVIVYKIKESNEMVEDSLPMWPFNGIHPPEHNSTFVGSIMKSKPLCIENRRDNDAHYFLS